MLQRHEGVEAGKSTKLVWIWWQTEKYLSMPGIEP